MAGNDPKKYAEKHWHKVNGKVYSLEETIYGGILVIMKGTKKAPRFIPMQFGKNGEIKDRVLQLKPGDRVKCRFAVRGVEYTGKWYTNLDLKDFSPWIVNEEKLKKQESLDKYKKDKDFEKGHNLFNPWGNEGLKPDSDNKTGEQNNRNIT